ncbi:uncharacterized protein LOC112434373 [Maylandia zebra]|uniref:uncharacterized protein LOC112434373 n=1 Tax=Maylandia zebra TaxID=106582 RepID=UPI00403D08F2
MDSAGRELYERREAAFAQLEEQLRWKPWRAPDYERIFHGTRLALGGPKSCRKSPPVALPAFKPRPLPVGVFRVASGAHAPASLSPFFAPEAQSLAPPASSARRKRRACRHKLDNAEQLTVVSKLHALGYQPILFLGQFDRKGRIVGDVITLIEPAEGAARDILMKMRKLYEHLLRKLQASPPAKSSTPAAGPSSADSVDAGPVPDPEALNEEFILHLEPVPTSSLCQPPASSSPSLLPPASSSPSLLPPASSSPSLLPPASSSPSLLPPASSSPSLLPPASSSPSLLPPASSSPSLLPPASSSPSLLSPASSSPSPHPASPSISTVYTSDVPNKKRTRKECRKHRTQIFKYEEIVDRRVVNVSNLACCCADLFASLDFPDLNCA